MTHHTDARTRELVARWQVLAERRLAYLTELFETGRWRRYYSDDAFLENVREAKAAVGAWRQLSGQESDDEPSVIEAVPADGGDTPPPEIAVAPVTEPIAAEEAASPIVVDLVALERALNEPTEPMLDVVAMEQRYPLLHSSL
jgi:uncharacterized repeat protein (TIGR03809 family)